MSARGDLAARSAIALLIALVTLLCDTGAAAGSVPVPTLAAATTPFAPPGAVTRTPRDLTGKPDDTPPDTLIDSGPQGVTRDSTPTFEISSTEPGSTFECRIDEEPLADCTSPYTAPELTPGPHTFRAHAQDIATNFDPTPATRLFTVAPDMPTGHGPSAACHVTDGAFTACPDGTDEWSDIAPASFPDTDAHLYADQADLVPGHGTSRSPVDTFMLMYDECASRKPLKPDEFFVVSFDTTEHAPGKPTEFVRYVVHVFGDGTLVMFENGELQLGPGGVARVHEIDGQHAAAGFGPSPDCTANHLVVEYDIELEAAGGHSYSPAPAWWAAHASGGGNSTNPGTTCPRQVGTSASGGSSPWAAGLITKPGTDVDKDGLDHADEIRLATDPCNHDTDDDGLIDSWEVQDPSVPGAGFDLDGNGRVDVPSKLVFGSGFDAPSPLRKDVYVEVDSYDCKVGGCPPFDPMVHGLNAAAKTDVERMFNNLGMSLHIIDDEHIAHAPDCDRPPPVNRSRYFGSGFDNPLQEDLDGDGEGDACDPDIDADGTANGSDAHPRDSDDDGIDNPADSDDDGDGIVDTADNCKLTPNAGQGDVDGDLTGDACDDDADGDGAPDGLERPTGSDRLDAASTPEYVGWETSCSDGVDNDGDGQTDGSDPGCVDSDGDTLPDSADPCPTVSDEGWSDTDGDGLGNACDPDSDNDGVTDTVEDQLGSDSMEATSTPEDRSIDGVCLDGVDNDRDGLTDADDPRCELPSKLGPPAIRPGFDATAFAANDDDSTGPVPLGFDIGFGGHTYGAAYVNNNGNLTFEGPLGDYVPFDLKTAPDPIVAPFFGDVDTRDGSVVRYGTSTVDGRPAFGVTWPGVGCYPRNTSKRNAFQAVLVDRSDVAAGAFDIEFNYDQIEWDPGELSACAGEVSTRPGQARDAAVQTGAARAGYSDATGAPDGFAELDGSGVEDAFIDTNLATGLVHGARDSTVPGRYVFKIRPPAADTDGDGVGDEIDDCPEVANASQQDTGLTGIGDACRPERNTTAGFLQAKLDATTGVEPTSTLLADAPSMLDRLVRMVADELATGQTDSAQQLTSDLVDSVVGLGLVSAADAPKLRSDVLDRVLGPRTPPPPPPPPGIGPPLTPPGSAPTPPRPRDTVAPVLSGLSVTPRVFPVARGGRTVVVARMRYTLSEAAHVRFEVQRPKTGRLSRGACKPLTHRLAGAPHCTRYKTVALLGQNGVRGSNARAFNGRAGRAPLGPGRYRIAAVARDAAGNRSRPRTAFFRIFRR